MSRATFLAALVTGGLAIGVAHAAGWSDYEGAFPMFPCNDGWMGCRVDGAVHSADLVNDGSGLPAPSAWRVSWFELAPTAAFSPFGGLSGYTGEAPPGMGAEPEPAPEVEPEPALADAEPDREAEQAARRAGEESRAAKAAQRRAAEEAAAAVATADRAQAEAARQEEAARRAEEQASQASEEERSRLEAEAATARAAAAEAEAAQRAAEEAERQQEEARLAAQAAAAKAEEDRVAAEAAAKAEEERRKADEEAAAVAAAAAAAAAPPPPEGDDAVADAAEVGGGDPPSAGGGDCGELVKLEPMAMLGKLDGGTAAACEARLGSTEKQTDKDKISRLLMTNAYSKGDKKEWERLVKRHLNEIDRSDPDLCYKYALHLNRKGAGAASGVIRWVDVALENRMVWTGDTYTSRVYSLYKLKSGASQKLWKKAEETHAAAPSDQTQGEIEKWRNQTKVFSREWYEYAKTSGKDTTVPLQLCMSAAGTADYCEAG
ncbi:MAG: chemotaxis protein histidine kinase CheA [Myxococcota bacterium]|jgi:chemotaxis protein histidine kinase CheA